MKKRLLLQETKTVFEFYFHCKEALNVAGGKGGARDARINQVLIMTVRMSFNDSCQSVNSPCNSLPA